MAELVTELLKLAFPEEQIACVSSQSADRVKDIDAFRQGKKGILVTTTILERGVTFPGCGCLCAYGTASRIQFSKLGSNRRSCGEIYRKANREGVFLSRWD